MKPIRICNFSPPIGRFLCLALCLDVFLTTVVVGAETNSPAESLAARVEKARSEKKINNRLSELDGVGKNLSLSEIPEAIKAAEGLKQLRERIVLSEATLKRWGELAPAKAFAHTVELPEGLQKTGVIRTVAAAYARQDVKSAATAVTKMKAGRSRNEAVEIIAEIWAVMDVNAALKWAKDLPPEGFPKERALRRIYFTWVHSDPAGASSTVQNLPDGDIKNALLMNVASDWAAIAPADAVKWAEALPQEPDKKVALATVVESWADADPVAAAQFALKLSPPELKQQAVLAALDRWATQDPQQAFSWAVKLPDPTLQERGVAQVLSACTSACPESGSRWVEQLPPGPVRESAIGSYVEAVNPWNPEAGARLALKTSDSTVRQQRVGLCFQLWLMWAPDDAKKWLKETAFSEDIKGRWLLQKAEQEP